MFHYFLWSCIIFCNKSGGDYPRKKTGQETLHSSIFQPLPPSLTHFLVQHHRKPVPPIILIFQYFTEICLFYREAGKLLLHKFCWALFVAKWEFVVSYFGAKINEWNLSEATRAARGVARVHTINISYPLRHGISKTRVTFILIFSCSYSCFWLVKIVYSQSAWPMRGLVTKCGNATVLWTFMANYARLRQMALRMTTWRLCLSNVKV